MPGAHTGAMRERSDASSHQAAISPIRIANDAYHRRARAHAISRVELPPNATASSREQRLAEATHTWTTRTQALCKSAAMLAVAEPQSRRSRLTTTHPFGRLARAPPAESSLDPLRSHPCRGGPHRGLPIMPGAHAGDMHERGHVSGRRAAVTTVEVANRTPHRRARAHAPSAASSRGLSDRFLT